MIEGLCGPRYSRDHPYRRGGGYTKRLVTALGMITFKVKRVINRETGKVSSPILEALDIKHRKYSRGVRMACAEYASKMSYGDASLEYKTGTGIQVPKRTIHTWVQEIAPTLLEAYKAEADTNKDTVFPLVMGDSTKVRGLGSGEMNNVRVITTGKSSTQLQVLGVNTPWPRTHAKVLVSDDEEGLVNAVEADRRQLCILHAVKRLGFILWSDGMSLKERKKALNAIKEPLFTLVNSTRKHLLDGDMDRLKWRIEHTREELRRRAEELRVQGYPEACEYLEKHTPLLVTFAELALEGIQVPYTNNLIERLMGEISKRCKNKWMHWSTKGLRNILTIILVRYTDREAYQRFKNAYIHNQPISNVKSRILTNK